MTQRTLYFDLVGGAAGDMIVASLLDLGASLDRIRDAWARVGLERVTGEVKRVDPAGLRALSFDVRIDGLLADVETSATGADGPGVRPHHPPEPRHHHHAPHHHHHGHRSYSTIVELLAGADLPPPVVRMAQDTFRRLAEAEAQAHGVSLDEVIFHEVGADDALADVLGACVALHDLAVDRVVVSPFPLGRGVVQGGHGPIPLPGPATLHLLTGAPTVGTDLIGETVTPTGAAVLMAMADGFGAAPAMIVRATGTGAGHKRWPDRPNVVRAVLGEATTGHARDDEDVVVQANVDDMRPEDLGPLLDALFEAGAADAWGAPLYMKKGRPGLKVSALVRRSLEPAIVEAFMVHSPTLGVRVHDVRRFRAERRMLSVSTDYGEVRVKVAPRPDGTTLVAPEFDDCVARAKTAKVAARRIYEAALRAAWAQPL